LNHNAPNLRLADPIILKFPAHEAVYPLSLTANTKQPTKILIYILGKSKMACGGRLETVFAEERPFRDSKMFDREIEPDGFLDDVHGSLLLNPYITKFRGILKPEEMKQDLVFTPAPDNLPVREHLTIW